MRPSLLTVAIDRTVEAMWGTDLTWDRLQITGAEVAAPGGDLLADVTIHLRTTEGDTQRHHSMHWRHISGQPENRPVFKLITATTEAQPGSFTTLHIEPTAQLKAEQGRPLPVYLYE